jgi:hypothetical protein
MKCVLYHWTSGFYLDSIFCTVLITPVIFQNKYKMNWSPLWFARLCLRGLLFGKLTVGEQCNGGEKEGTIWYKFYILFNITCYSEHVYSDVHDTNCAGRKCGLCVLLVQNTFRLHGLLGIIESAEGDSKLVFLLLLGLFLSLSLFPLKCHIFLQTNPFVVFTVLGFSGSG